MASTSGISFCISSLYRWARQPATIRAFICPLFLSSAISRMVLMLSSLASPIKQQVFTITASALLSSSVNRYPFSESAPSITSESTRFLSQPREISNTFMYFSFLGTLYMQQTGRSQPGSFAASACKLSHPKVFLSFPDSAPLPPRREAWCCLHSIPAVLPRR